MNILGMFGPGENPSASLLINGKLVALIEEERINRIKTSPNNLPIQSAKKCLEIAGITINQVDAIAWGWDLLTNVWGLPKDRLFVTVFAGDDQQGVPPDDEAADLWLEVTDLDPSQISRWGVKDNFWEMGDTGPCGVNSEVHIDRTPDRSGSELVNRDDPRVAAGRRHG